MKNGRRFTTRCRIDDVDIAFYLGQIVRLRNTGEEGVVFSITHFLDGEPSLGVYLLTETDDGTVLSGETMWHVQGRFESVDSAKDYDQFLSLNKDGDRAGYYYAASWPEWKKSDAAMKATRYLKSNR